MDLPLFFAHFQIRQTYWQASELPQAKLYLFQLLLKPAARFQPFTVYGPG